MNINHIICACGSLDHQLFFWYDLEGWGPQLYVCSHLTTHRNILQRIKYAIKYIFGYKSRYGAWDEFLFDDKGEQALRDYLNERNDNQNKQEI